MRWTQTHLAGQLICAFIPNGCTEHRAHLNLLEQAIPFAVLVLILQAIGGFSPLTYWTCIAFFWLRVIHAAGMVSGLTRLPLRPMIFLAGWACCLILAYAVFAARM